MNAAAAKDFVDRVLDGDFSDVEAVLPNLSEPQREILADHICECLEEKLLLDYILDTNVKSISTWEELVTGVGLRNFAGVLNLRVVFGDPGHRFMKHFIQPYYNFVVQHAHEMNMDTVQGRAMVLKGADVLLNAWMGSTYDSPLFFRECVARMKPPEELRERNGMLSVTSLCMIAFTIPILMNPTLCGVTKGIPKQVAEGLAMVAGIWEDVARQETVRPEPVPSYILAMLPKVKTFFKLYMDVDDIEKCRRILATTGAKEEREKELAIARFERFCRNWGVCESPKLSMTNESATQVNKELEDKMQAVHWQKRKSAEDVIEMILPSTSKEKTNMIVIKFEGLVDAPVQVLHDRFEEKFFSSKYNRSINKSQRELMTSDQLIRFNMPFPFSTRTASFRTEISVAVNKIICLWSGKVTSSKSSLGHVLASGYKINEDQRTKKTRLQLIWHFDPNGNLPQWVVKSLTKPMLMGVQQICKEAELQALTGPS